MEATKLERVNSEKMKSISHALKLLNDAAEESADEIRSMVRSDYRRLKNVLAEVKPEVHSALSEIGGAVSESIGEAKERVVATTRETAHKVDESVHEHPWAYIGGAAAMFALVGFLLGRRSKD